MTDLEHAIRRTRLWCSGYGGGCMPPFATDVLLILDSLDRKTEKPDPIVTSPDLLALQVATRLRNQACNHGLPYRVVSKEPVPPWGEGATCRPLCDACVMEAVRAVLGEKGTPNDHG